MSDVKKAKAAATRADDLVKEQERANLKQAREKEVKEQAAKVREQTADDVTDTAKRVFYEQRLATAKATKCAPARESAGRVRGRRGRVRGECGGGAGECRVVGRHGGLAALGSPLPCVPTPASADGCSRVWLAAGVLVAASLLVRLWRPRCWCACGGLALFLIVSAQGGGGRAR